jgi:hypothetical protein
MKQSDWVCVRCWSMMRSTRNGHMICRNLRCTARMRRLWAVKDLPLARRVDYRRFTIADCGGYWEYVPHAHRGSLTRPPAEGHVVAKVGRWASHKRPMTFRQCKPPRSRK